MDNIELLPPFKPPTSVNVRISTDEEVQQGSAHCISDPSIAHGQSTGVIAESMGATGMRHNQLCETCHRRSDECVGHYGHIAFAYPVKRAMLKASIIRWLRAVCYSCYQPVVGDYLKFHKAKDRFDHCRSSNTVTCQRCGEPRYTFKDNDINPTDVITNAPLIGSDRVPLTPKQVAAAEKRFTDVVSYQSPMFDDNGFRMLFNTEILEFFNRIPTSTLEEFGMTPREHPALLLYTNGSQPSNHLRSETPNSNGRHAFNAMIAVLVQVSNQIRDAVGVDYITTDAILNHDVKPGTLVTLDALNNLYLRGPPKTVHDDAVAMNNVASRRSGVMPSLVQVTSRKPGIPRGCQLGFRSEGDTRGVITCNDTNQVDEITIPRHIAMKRTQRINVTARNYDQMVATFKRGERYPGCTRLISGGVVYDVRYCGNRELAIGDSLECHIRDGTIGVMDRPPSLSNTSNTAEYIKVSTGAGMLTALAPMEHRPIQNSIEMNAAICNMFNADFDGDAMMLSLITSIIARVEAAELVGMPIKLADREGTPSLMSGDFQDALLARIYMSLLQRAVSGKYVPQRLSKLMAMMINGGVRSVGLDFSTSSDLVDYSVVIDVEKDPLPRIDDIQRAIANGAKADIPQQNDMRSIISLTMPDVNMTGVTSKMYNDLLSKSIKNTPGNMINYNRDDLTVEITNGRLTSGVVDKSISGVGVPGSIYHLAYPRVGPRKVLDLIADTQRQTSQCIMLTGSSTGAHDMILSESALAAIAHGTGNQIERCRKLLQDITAGTTTAPLGMTNEQYYFESVHATMGIDDTTINAIFGNVNFADNNFVRMVVAGAKGSKANAASIFGAVGMQTQLGGPMQFDFDGSRCNGWSFGSSMEPEDIGFIANSYGKGIDSREYNYAVRRARDGVTGNAIKAPVSGTLSRRMVHAFQGAIAGHYCEVTDGGLLVEPLAGGLGVDTLNYVTVRIPHVMTTTVDFEQILDGAHDDEKRVLTESRAHVRHNAFEDENQYGMSQLVSSKALLPVDVNAIIHDTIKRFDTATNAKKALKRNEIFAIVNAGIDLLPYVYSSSTGRKNKLKLPVHIHHAMKTFIAFMRLALNSADMHRKNITREGMEIILAEIYQTYQRSLVPAGQAIGVLAAQALSRAATQFALDSKHEVGVKTTAQNPVTRMTELTSATPGYLQPGEKRSVLSNPVMRIRLTSNDYEDYERMANTIEMVTLKSFLTGCTVQLEPLEDIAACTNARTPLGTPCKVITNALRYQPSNVSGLSSGWVIHFSFNQQSLMMKDKSIADVTHVIADKYPGLIVLSSAIAQTELYCYVRRNNPVMSSGNLKQALDDLVTSLEETILSGVPNIVSASIERVMTSEVVDDGSIQRVNRYVIDTIGSNVMDIMMIPGVDAKRTTSNDVVDLARVCGVHTARNKMTAEIMSAMNMNKYTVSPMTSILTATGQPTSVRVSGIAQRNPKDFLRAATTSEPTSYVCDAASRNTTTEISGAVTPLICGINAPKIGTSYSRIVCKNEVEDDGEFDDYM